MNKNLTQINNLGLALISFWCDSLDTKSFICKHDRRKPSGLLKATALQPSLVAEKTAKCTLRHESGNKEPRMTPNSPANPKGETTLSSSMEPSVLQWSLRSGPRWRTPSGLLVSACNLSTRALVSFMPEKRCVRGQPGRAQIYNFLWFFFLIYKITLFCTFSLQVSEIRELALDMDGGWIKRMSIILCCASSVPKQWMRLPWLIF